MRNVIIALALVALAGPAAAVDLPAGDKSGGKAVVEGTAEPTGPGTGTGTITTPGGTVEVSKPEQKGAATVTR